MQELFQFRRQTLNVRFFQHAGVNTWNEMNPYAASSEFTPAQLLIADPVTRLLPDAKNLNSSFISLWHKVRTREVNFMDRISAGLGGRRRRYHLTKVSQGALCLLLYETY